MLFVELVEKLSKKNLTLSSAESITGGLFAKKITDVPGSSSVFLGSIISYSTEAKEKLLNVDKNTINEHTVISKEVSVEMCTGLKNNFNSDIFFSFTGNAGPDVQGKKPVGEVWISILIKDILHSYNLNSNLKDRKEIREQTADFAAKKILDLLD